MAGASGAQDGPHTRLNGDDGGGLLVPGAQGTVGPPVYGPYVPGARKPGGDTDLVHSEAGKRKAAGYLEKTLGPDVHKAAVMADEDSEAITGNPDVPTSVRSGGGGTLTGWEVRAGLETRSKRWAKRAKVLENRLRGERETLLDVNAMFGRTDVLTDNKFAGLLPPAERPRSKLDDF